ncbi:acyltransferase family protein [Curvibacter sp. APW13]|uniref:acyltransferase family protein n=1 Tax=Curvibacter sp. APW13 TaxID=3077236 RepID=UPI0028DE7B3F|nr:acyltransferase family protein [Curvibacter sp. APW13]MDT8991559.1 acyltransferase family protein [Curvibacter sp. APW13]
MRIAYRPDIDGLRAIAVLAVVVFHAFPQLVPGGFIGVDVFFVISGYLITSILSSELSDGSWSIAAFYGRRILRIFPALLLVLVTCFLVGWYTLLASEYKQLGKHLAAGAVFVSNFTLWFEAGYFDKVSEAKPLLHLWSLGIEEQFYIVWPLLLLGIARLRRHTLRVVLLVALTSLGAATWLAFSDPTQAFYSPLSRAWELLAGAMLALLPASYCTRIGPKYASLLSWLALVALLASVFLMRSGQLFPGVFVLPPVLATTVLIGLPTSGAVHQRFLSHPAMVAVGKISYPLYLWHWPLLSFAYIMASGHPPAWVTGLLLLASVVLSALTYLLVEKPIHKLPRKWVIGGLVLGVASIGLLGSNIDHRDGLERIRHRKLIQLNDQALQDFADFERTGLITEAKCHRPFVFPEREVCLFSRPDGAITASVVGDSHAVHAFWGLAQALPKDRLKVDGKGACMPLLGYAPVADRFGCQPEMDSILKEISATQSVKKVFLVSRGYVREGAAAEEVARFKEALVATVQFFSQAGKQVFYLQPVIEPGFDPRLCMGHLPFGRRPPYPCELSEAQANQIMKPMQTVLEEVALEYPQLTVLNPNAGLCAQGVCNVVQDGHSVFKDDNHLSHYGSLKAGISIARQLHQ